MKPGSTLLRTAACIALLFSSSGRSNAEELIVSIPTPSAIFAYFDIANTRGYWKEVGLDVKQVYTPGVAATNAILSGSAHLGHNTGGTLIRANSRGGDLVAIANVVDRPLTEVILRKDVADRLKLTMKDPVADRGRALKGLTIAVNALNTIIHGFLSYSAVKGGLDPEKDLVVSPMEASAMLAALRTKQIDGFVFSAPFTATAIRDGSGVTWISAVEGDFPELHPFGYNLIVTKQGFCEKRPGTCEKYIQGLNRALEFMHDNKEESIKILRARFDKMEPDLVAATFEQLLKATPRVAKVDERVLVNAQKFAHTAGQIRDNELVSNFKGYFDNRYVK